MVKLLLQDNILLLESSEDDEVFNWEHRLFFSVVVEYQYDQTNSCYRISATAEMLEVLRETVDYLRSESIRFEVDEAIKGLLNRLQNEQSDYENAVLMLL